MRRVCNSDILFYLTMLVLLIIPIISIWDNLGIYFDACFPDYAATQVLSSQEHSVKWFASWPFLVQFYHGSPTMWVTALITLLFGKTGIVQYRIQNAVMMFIIILFLGKILRANQVHKKLRRVIVCLCVVMPTTLGICLTQYYLELPGAIFTLAAVYFLTNMKLAEIDSSKRNKTAFLAFALLGLAFYSYFNYLFFFPGLAISYVLLGETKQRRIEYLLRAFCGFLCGAILYFVGYAMFIADALEATKYRNAIGIVTAIAVLSLTIGLNSLLERRKVYLVLKCFIGMIVAGISVVLLLWQDIEEYVIIPLSVRGTSATFMQRLQLVGLYVKKIITGTGAEELIYQTVETKWQDVLFISFLVCTALWVMLYLFRKIPRPDLNFDYILTLLLSLICSIPFASRMGVQHFILVPFLAIIIFSLSVDRLLSYLLTENDGTRVKNILRGGVFVCVAVLIVFCVFDRYAFVNNINLTGGKGYYTSQLNVLAEEAIIHSQNGDKEIYVFPEWGFMTSFNYLTNNSVAFSVDCSTEALRLYKTEGYKINVLYWDAGNKNIYLNSAARSGNKCINELEYYQNDGTVAFYKIELV